MKFSPSENIINKIAVVILLIFAGLYALLCLPNHYYYRTNAMDLGMFNHAIWCFSHFKMNYFTLEINGYEQNYFSDHFAPITALLSPLYYLFGSYTLLIVQILSVLFGAWGLYKYAKLKFSSLGYPVLFLLHFLGLWGISSALASDFHTNVLAAMMVPWLFYYYEVKNKKLFYLCVVFILLTKENMALWLFFLLITLYLQKPKAENRINLTYPIIITLLYFIIVLELIMPSLKGFNSSQGSNWIYRYNHLGSNAGEIVTNLFTNPIQLFFTLFDNPTGIKLYDNIKIEFHFLLFVSGGWAILYKPKYLISIIPLFAQKFLTNDCEIWGISKHYSIEFAPLISLALIDFSSTFASKKYYWILPISVLLSTYYFHYQALEERVAMWYNPLNHQFYIKEHYSSHFNTKSIEDAMKLIPPDSTICTSSNLSPHLANRKKIYLFPNVKDASYVILLTHPKASHYPLNDEDFQKQIVKLQENRLFEKTYEKDSIIVFQKSTNIDMNTLINIYINKIKESPEWLKLVEEKAVKEQVPLDTMLYRDALYMIKNNM